MDWIESLKARVAERVTKEFAVAVRDAGNRRTVDATALEDSLYRKLEKQVPLIAPVDVRAEDVVHVRIVDLKIKTRLVSSRDLAAEYEVETEHPNPRLPHLRHRLGAARRRFHECRAQFQHLESRYEHHRRHMHGDNPEDRKELRRLRHHLEDAEDELEDSECELARAKRALDRAPATVTEVTVHHWPYEWKEYRKAGRFELWIDVGGISGTGNPEKQSVDYKVTASDEEILNANPDVGVDPDFLELPQDEWIRNKLIADAAHDLTTRIRRAVLAARVNEWQQAMNELRAQGTPADALEAGVNAGLVLETYDRAAATRLMNSLRKVNGSLALE